MQTTTLWEEIVADPRFEDFPYKVETNQHGQVILSPTRYGIAAARVV